MMQLIVQEAITHVSISHIRIWTQAPDHRFTCWQPKGRDPKSIIKSTSSAIIYYSDIKLPLGNPKVLDECTKGDSRMYHVPAMKSLFYLGSDLSFDRRIAKWFLRRLGLRHRRLKENRNTIPGLAPIALWKPEMDQPGAS